MAIDVEQIRVLSAMELNDGSKSVANALDGCLAEIAGLRQQLAARDELLKSLHQRAYMRLAYHECGEIERLLGLPSVVDHELEDLK